MSDRHAIVVWNKIDVAEATGGGPYVVGESGDADRSRNGRNPLTSVRASALTGEGIDDLRSATSPATGANGGAQQEASTNVRQQKLVEEALAALAKAAAAVPQRIPHEMLLLDLYAALRPLDDITGATTADDILNLIFSSFCIGK